ncbi:MAG: helix-turn-helix domain-containing protein [Deltaproteobacteria bacterium]|nr:helix-turn-helix domain-containing protein [Deltaproteobacteria bacterium]
MRPVLTLADAADLLRLTPGEVAALVDRGELTAARLADHLLFTRADLDAFLARRGSRGLPAARMAPRTRVAVMGAAVALALGLAWQVRANYLNATLVAGIPALIPYQGVLESDGLPVNGSTPMTFALYDAASGGAELWNSGQQDVPVTAGRFSVVLGGAGTPLPGRLFLDRHEAFLDVSVNGQQLANRQLLVPVPYAVRAGYAAQAEDFQVTGALTANSVTTTSLTSTTTQAGTLTAAAITASSVTAPTVTASTQVTAGSLTVTDAAAATSMNTNGYARIPGSPLSLYWGTGVSNLDTQQVFTFLRPFTTACLGVYANRLTAGTANPFDPISCTTAGFTMDRADAVDGTENFTYLAIGY